MTISRRQALRDLLSLGVTGLVAPALAGAKPRESGLARVDLDPPRSGAQATEDMYRQEFAETYGDPREHGFAYHCVNCQGNCAWEVWIADGRVTRENQSSRYPQLAPDIPDANPRGCNKGVQHSHAMYEDDRLLFPMRRAGERGEGKWKRISWDEAITEIATRLYETLRAEGPAGNYIHVGAGLLTECRAASIKRLGTLLGAVRPYIASYVGDMFPGATVVYGEGNIGCSFDYLYTTDVSVFWGINPNTSRIPDAHYIWEGKYNGSKVVVIAPELNSTAIHADLWVPVKPGYDGHLALSIAHHIVAKKLYKEDFLKTYTDLPLLVRTDTKDLLRLADLDPTDPGFDAASRDRFGKLADKAHEVFAVFNRLSGLVTLVPGSEGSNLDTLRLQDVGWHIDPALEGTWTVKLASGATVEVTTVFALWRAELARYEPAAMQPLTGVHPDVVAELARDLTSAKNAVISLGFAIGKHFNGLLSQRAIANLTALCGRLGPLGGLNTENEWNITGLAGLAGFDGKYNHRFASGFVSEFVLGDQFEDYEKQYSDEEVLRATGLSKAEYRRRVEELLAKSQGDEGYTEGKAYWNAVETFLIFADARFRRNKGSYQEAFLRKAKFLAYGDYRMSDFALYADVLLPCKSHYEVWDIRVNPGYHRFANLAVPPLRLKPVGEAKSEWEIATLVVEKLQELAQANFRATGDPRTIRIPDKTHSETGFRALDELVADFTAGGKLRTDKDAVQYALEHVEQFKPNDARTMIKRGGFLSLNEKAGKSSPLYKNRPYMSFEANLFLHQRFETLTGRLTFYVDHPAWIEAGVHVPVAREPIRTRKYPFLLMTPHARWSIHSTYKTSPILLRLQRGKPYVMLHPDVARRKGIVDGQDVRMFNDMGEAILMAKVMPGIPPDAVMMEHGWEPFMYRGKRGHNRLQAEILNLLEVSDGWGHLEFGVNWDGNQHAYDATVDVAPV